VSPENEGQLEGTGEENHQAAHQGQEDELTSAHEGPRGGCSIGMVVHQYGPVTVYSDAVLSTLRHVLIAAAITTLGVGCGGSSPVDVATPVTFDTASSEPVASVADSGAAADEATAPPASSPGDDVSAEWVHGWTGDLIGGGQIDANALAGQDIVLWFWAPW